MIPIKIRLITYERLKSLFYKHVTIIQKINRSSIQGNYLYLVLKILHKKFDRKDVQYTRIIKPYYSRIIKRKTILS